MPPTYAYHYWKCYYPKAGSNFKAAALYSTEVDYFKFGQCRLVELVANTPGTYYCGPMSVNQPHKGLTSTVEAASHIGNKFLTKMQALTHTNDGDILYKAENYAKLQTPMNKAYYTASNSGNSGADNYAYTHHLNNNGQRLGWPTHLHSDHDSSTTALYNNGEILQPVKMEYNHATAAATVASGVTNLNANSASNYAMNPGAAAQYSGVHFAGETAHTGLTPPTHWAWRKSHLP